MRFFIVKLSTVFLFLACILMAANILTGALPLAGGFALLAVCGAATHKMIGLSLHRPARRRRAAHKAPPALRVVRGGHFPGGPKAA